MGVGRTQPDGQGTVPLQQTGPGAQNPEPLETKRQIKKKIFIIIIIITPLGTVLSVTPLMMTGRLKANLQTEPVDQFGLQVLETLTEPALDLPGRLGSAED